MTQDGPAVEIDFRTLKGQRPGNARKEENPLLLLLPIRSQQYFADAAAHLFALACVSNVFVWPISSIATMATDDTPRPFPITYEASTQPVVVSRYSQHSKPYLTAEHYKAHLTQDCKRDLWGLSTAYSWRRTALTEMACQQGLEAAQNLAYHRQSTTLYHYVRLLQTLDLQASRVGDTPRDESDNANHFKSPAAMR